MGLLPSLCFAASCVDAINDWLLRYTLFRRCFDFRSKVQFLRLLRFFLFGFSSCDGFLCDMIDSSVQRAREGSRTESLAWKGGVMMGQALFGVVVTCLDVGTLGRTMGITMRVCDCAITLNYARIHIESTQPCDGSVPCTHCLMSTLWFFFALT